LCKNLKHLYCFTLTIVIRGISRGFPGDLETTFEGLTRVPAIVAPEYPSLKSKWYIKTVWLQFNRKLIYNDKCGLRESMCSIGNAKIL